MTFRRFMPIALIVLAGCNLFGSPTSTVKSFMTAAEKGNVDDMNRLFSAKAIDRLGLDKIKANNQRFADHTKRAADSGGRHTMEDVVETSEPSGGRRVSFLYRNAAGTDSMKLVFDLTKEGLVWKIDNLFGPELEQTVPLDPTIHANPLVQPSPTAPPFPVSEKGEIETKTTTKNKTISGGVLNGKAISLPKPAYPPIARAAKAGGSVAVQVVVDENGNVISASPVSGHPLLRAAATAAARGAKFSPTKLSGQPVRVTGIIVYQFNPE